MPPKAKKQAAGRRNVRRIRLTPKMVANLDKAKAALDAFAKVMSRAG